MGQYSELQFDTFIFAWVVIAETQAFNRKHKIRRLFSIIILYPSHTPSVYKTAMISSQYFNCLSQYLYLAEPQFLCSFSLALPLNKDPSS